MISLLALFDAHGGRCTYCGCETYVAGTEPRSVVAQRFGIALGMPGCKKRLRYRRATREHLVRIADGGGDKLANLTLACAFCNIARERATPERHRLAIARAIAAGLHPNHPSFLDRSRRAAWRERRLIGLSPSGACHVG